MKRRIISLVLVLAIACFLASCSSSDHPEQIGETKESTSGSSVNIPIVTESLAPTLASEGNLGNAYVTINHFELCEDYKGRPSILIVYSFTNNDNESQMAMTMLSEHAFQNGVELKSATLRDREDYDFSAATKKIQAGATIEIPVAYLLTSETAPVEFEIIENFSFSSNMVGGVFEIYEGGITELSQAPEGVMDIEVGDYLVSVVAYRKTTNYEGKPVIVLKLGFTNNSNNSEIFSLSVDLTAFQNGIELESAIMLEDEYDSHTRHAYVKPGAGVTVYCAFILDDDSPVDFEVQESFSFNDELYTFTIELSE